MERFQYVITENRAGLIELQESGQFIARRKTLEDILFLIGDQENCDITLNLPNRPKVTFSGGVGVLTADIVSDILNRPLARQATRSSQGSITDMILRSMEDTNVLN